MASTSKTGTLPHWDLTNIYPSLESAELKQAIAQTQADLTALEGYLDTHHISKTGSTAQPSSTSSTSSTSSINAFADIVNGYLEHTNALLRLFYTVSTYISLSVATDSFNTTARRMRSEIDPLGVQFSQIDTRFTGWLGGLQHLLPEVIARGGLAAQHAFYLHETAEQSRYMMSEPEEALAAELSLSGATAWSKLQGTITSQLTVEMERNGTTEKLPMPAIINIMQHDPDAEVRREAYELEHAAWASVKEPLAACMNGVKGAAVVLNRKRGRVDALHAPVEDARIDRETLDAMMGAMRDSFPTFRKYLRAKARRLGHEGGLPWWDLFAPVGKSEHSYSWDEAQNLVITNFAQFSPQLARLAQTAFERNWIDAEQRTGKRGGAFCSEVAAVDESRILCNFDGSLDQVSTVAHELGHAFHNHAQVGKTILQTITPMTLAETASIMCETLLIDAALRDAKSADEELAILETDLIGKTQVIVDITSRYLFEQEVFERRAKSELSADDLCEIMLRCQKETYGDGLDERYLHPWMWTWKPHYYTRSFYNFPYAFGLLFATGLYAIYQKRGADFVPDYIELLASTGEGSAADLAARFGINLHERAFWQASLDVIGQRIERYCEL